MKTKIKFTLGIVGIVLILLIGGIAFSVYPLYRSAQKIEVLNQYTEITEEEDTVIDIKAYIDIQNPENEIIISELNYKVFIDDKFIGENSKKDTTISKGNSTLELPFTFDLMELNETIPEVSIDENETFEDFNESRIEELPIDEEVELEVKTDITVPVMWFDLVKLTEYTMSFSHKENIEVPINE
ncbi:MAG: hypothetical protein ACOCTT_01440 [archaeon]